MKFKQGKLSKRVGKKHQLLKGQSIDLTTGIIMALKT